MLIMLENDVSGKQEDISKSRHGMQMTWNTSSNRLDRNSPKARERHLEVVMTRIQKARRLLLNQLRVWRGQGDRIILMMDANEHVLTGRLCRQLGEEGIGLREITKDHLGTLCPNTHSAGSMQIDRVWTTSDVTVTNVQWLPYSESPGDHRACIFDVTTLSVIGSYQKKIVHPNCRRLTSKRPDSVRKYIAEMERQFDTHRLDTRLETIIEEGYGQCPISSELLAKSERLDKQLTEIMTHCESRCRKIYRPDAPCSPEYSLWHKRARIFRELLRMKDGRVRNPGLLCRQAQKLGIIAPARWTVEELQYGRAIAIAWKRELAPEAPIIRSHHLSNLLVEAEAKGDQEKAKALRTMIDRENNSAMWTNIEYTFADNGGRSQAVTRVERVEDGHVREYTDQPDIERVVREETQARFSSAESSTFCQGLLGEQLGYISDTPTAAAILERAYEPPPDVSDATALLLDEIGRVGQQVSGHRVQMDIIVTTNFEHTGEKYGRELHPQYLAYTLVTTSLQVGAAG